MVREEMPASFTATDQWPPESLRFSSKLDWNYFVVTIVTYSRGMSIIQILIGFFCIFPADIANSKVKKLGFEQKVWRFFHKTRNTSVSKVKTKQNTRKYHSRRLFWYQPQLLTPNSEGERSIQRWDVDFTSSQGAICFKYKGNVKECQRIVDWSIS